MLAWMVYTIVLSLLLGLAALCAERLAVGRGFPSRAPWVAAIVLSCLLPLGGTNLLGMLSERLRPALPDKVAVWQRAAAGQLAADQWVAPLSTDVRQSLRVDSALTGLWWTSSTLALIAIGWPSMVLMRRRRLWKEESVAGVPVLVSESEGPAVIGHWRPRIVVPRWLLQAPASQQRAVLAHELQHIEARDSRWILLALAAVVSLPWCLPLWWQMRQLRRAIEVDCDARVVAAGLDRRQYGETLLAVGERQTACPTGVAGMAEPRAFLERRMALLFRTVNRRWSASAVILAGLSASLVVVAAEIRPSHEPAAQTPAMLAAPLEAFAGYFRLPDHQVLWLHVKDGTMIGILTSFEPTELKAEGPYRLVAHEGAARIDFKPDGVGHLDSLVLTLAGLPQEGTRIDAEAAAANEAWIHAHVAGRIKANTPYEHGADTVRSLEEGLVAGNPPYGAMTPPMVMATQAQLPALQKGLAENGPIEAITFKGVDEGGWDRYDVKHKVWTVHWLLELDEHGKISGARVLSRE